MFSEYPTNTKTVNNKGQLFWHLIVHIAIKKRQNPRITEGKNPRITNFVHINKPRIVKTANNKPADKKALQYWFSHLFPLASILSYGSRPPLFDDFLWQDDAPDDVIINDELRFGGFDFGTLASPQQIIDFRFLQSCFKQVSRKQIL